MNTDESELALFRAERRVREIQAKLHRWADHDPKRDLWSARCPETGTAGAGGGSGKPTGGNTGRAPRADLTVHDPLRAPAPACVSTGRVRSAIARLAALAGFSPRPLVLDLADQISTHLREGMIEVALVGGRDEVRPSR